eukprot:g32381.t1
MAQHGWCGGDGALCIQRTEDGRGQSTVAGRPFGVQEVLFREPPLAISFQQTEPLWAQQLRSKLLQLDTTCAWQYCLAVRCLDQPIDLEGLEVLKPEEVQMLQEWGWKGRVRAGGRVLARGGPRGVLRARGAPGGGFHLLPDIQHVQPEEPHDGDAGENFLMPGLTPGASKSELGSGTSGSCCRSEPMCSPESVKSLGDTGSMASWLPHTLPGKRRAKVSPSFQRLVDQLVQQHLTELNERPRPPVIKARNFFTRSRGSGEDGNSCTSKLSDVLASSELKRPRGSASTTSTQLLLRNRQGMTPLPAERILSAFASEETEPLRQVNSNAAGSSDSGGETESNFKRRFQNFSRFQKLRWWLQSNNFEMMISAALCLNIFWMALELQIEGLVMGYNLGTYPDSMVKPNNFILWDHAFAIVDMLWALFFGLEVCIRVMVLGIAFWKSWLNYIDVAVSVISVVEVFVFMAPAFGVNPTWFSAMEPQTQSRAISALGLEPPSGKLLRGAESKAKERGATVQFVAVERARANAPCSVATAQDGADGSDDCRLCVCVSVCVRYLSGGNPGAVCHRPHVHGLRGDHVHLPSQDVQLRDDVFRYYGTFTRTFLSMFEIMFANWSPPCRVLVEHVSEWFSIFFLFYRCVLGFAVLNVVNAVFVQQTMKTASSDEDLAFKQREKDIAQYNRKVKKLFATMDSSGDGAINFEEFSKLVKSPKLRFWMSQLELEYHDLLSLFEFLDNGDGNITLHEFIDGAARLRGSAKAIDVWRMETKVEVLFEEVLNYLNTLRDGTQEPAWVVHLAEALVGLEVLVDQMVALARLALLEQRAQAMLMEALPESLKMEILTTRATSSVQVIFKVLVRYQPGGLGERAHLLKQLVEVRVPTSVGEMVTQLQMWRRWLRRAQELRVNVPDATLLMGALDKLSQPLGKVATQSAFRLSAIRANLKLMVDVNPTLEGVIGFAEALLAEGETAFHSGIL